LDGNGHNKQPPTDSPWAVYEAVGTGIAVTRPDGTLDFFNVALIKLMADGARTVLGASIFDLLDGANGDLQSLHYAALAKDTEQRALVRSASGKFLANAVLRRLTRGDGHHVVWSFVSTRGEELAPELALWGTEIGLWDWEVPSDRLIWINDWCEHSQLTAYAGSGHEKLWSARIHPEDLPAYRSAMTQHLDGRAPPYNVEYRLRDRDDVWVWIHERGRVIERDSHGKAQRVVGICLDVSERHNAARALARSESRFAHAVWGTSVGFWDVEVATDTLHWWNDWCTSVGLDPCEGDWHSLRWSAAVYPDDRPLVTNGHQALIEGRSQVFEVEYRIRTRAGHWHWILSRGRATARDDGGRAIHIAGVTIDIDARKRVELALRDSEARLEAATWGADIGLWDWNAEEDSLLWLSDWPARYGIEAAPRTVPRADWLARMHPEDRHKYVSEDHALLHNERNSAEADYRILTSDSEWRWVNVRTRVIERNACGRAVHIVGACIEVDTRRRAEQILRTQALILETMREGVVLLDLQGRIEFANPAFDRMFGRVDASAAAVASVTDLLNFPQAHQSARFAVQELLEKRNGRSGKRDVTFTRRDGTQFAAEMLSADIDLNGERRVLVVVQDVSERKQLEAEIIEIANHERRRLGGDLHDGIGQELTGISLMLRGLASRVGFAAAPVDSELDEIIGLVNHAIQSVRKLALGISPVTLERGGLLSALEALTARSRVSYKIDVRLLLRIYAPSLFDESMATHLYLIVQEAINNAVKHGQARSVIVKLQTYKAVIDLSISDDGVGIPAELARGIGMGLRIMEHRCSIVGGELQIKRRRGGGTRIRCVIGR
jgi:PAS domain S-box-containing protein